MNNSTEETISKRTKQDTLLEAVESDYRLNKSRLEKLKFKLIPLFLKDNFAFIVFIISGLGAFIQAVELSNIDLSYLRFFSVTQVASDGAMVFVTLTIFAVIGYAYYFFVTLKFREKNTSLYKQNNQMLHIPIAKPLLILFITVAYICIVISDSISIEDYRYMPIPSIIFTAMMIAVLAHFIKYSKYTNDEINRLESKDKDKEFFAKGLLAYITIISYIFIPVIIIKTLMIYSEILREPKDFENYNKLSLVIQEQHKDLSRYKVLYFNDKYTFIELTKEGYQENTIEVYKTDAILFDETVIRIKR